MHMYTTGAGCGMYVHAPSSVEAGGAAHAAGESHEAGRVTGRRRVTRSWRRTPRLEMYPSPVAEHKMQRRRRRRERSCVTRLPYVHVEERRQAYIHMKTGRRMNQVPDVAVVRAQRPEAEVDVHASCMHLRPARMHACVRLKIVRRPPGPGGARAEPRRLKF